MIGPRSGILLLGVGALAVYGSQGLWSRSVVAFTRTAPAAPASIDLRSSASTIHVMLPVDLSRVARRVEAALDQRFAFGLAVDAGDPACARRLPIGDCTPLKLDGAVRQSGRVEAAIRGHVVRISIPLTIDAPIAATMTARQPAPTSTQAERTPAAVTIGFSFSVRHTAGTGFRVVRIDESATDSASLQSAGPGARIARQLETRLRQVALAAQEELQQTLAALPVAAATQRAWTALSQPIPVGTGSGMSLNAMPEVVGAGELAAIAGNTVFRIPFVARIALGPTGPAATAPAATAPRKSAIHGVVQPGTNALVRMAVPIRLDGLQQAADAAFLKAGAMETKPDRFGPPVKVTVQRTRVYPSARQIAIELDLTATRYEGQTFQGKAHLVGRPVLDREQATVTLADLTFPPAPPRDAGGPKAPANAPRLATEPFAGMLTAIARIDVSRDAADAVPRAMNLLHQRIGDRLTLSANITAAKPAAVEMSRDGAWLMTDLSGELYLTYDGPQEIAAGVAFAEPAARPGLQPGPVSRAATPDTAAAAVVSASATSATLAARSAMGAPVSAAQESTREAVKPASARTKPAARHAEARHAEAGAARKGTQARQPPAALARRDWVPFASN